MAVTRILSICSLITVSTEEKLSCVTEMCSDVDIYEVEWGHEEQEELGIRNSYTHDSLKHKQHSVI